MIISDNFELASKEEISRLKSFNILKKRIPSFLISFIGEEGVGLTTFQDYYLNLQSQSKRTIDPTFDIKRLNVLGLTIKIKWWTISLDPYIISKMHYISGSSLIVFIYDITHKDSIKRLPKLRNDSFFKNRPIVLVGNKLDSEQERELSPDKVFAHVNRNNIAAAHIEISAETGEHVTELFELIGRYLIKTLNMDGIERQEKKYLYSLKKPQNLIGSREKSALISSS